MNIVRGTVQGWDGLEKIKFTFKKKGFEDIEKDSEGLFVTILDHEDLGKEFLKIILISEDFNKYYKYLEGTGGTGVTYLLLIKDFEEFVFVRESFTTLGKKKREAFKFSRSDPKRSCLEKLNNLEFNKIDSFENLFDTKEVVNQFYEDYKNKRTQLVSKIQGIKNSDDKENYAQIIFDRLIFLHFIQEKGFLNNDKKFLSNSYEQIKAGKQNYYEDFLKFLFFDVLNTPKSKRNLKHAKYNSIPFLNGGLFREHRIEDENPKIWISNDIIEDIINFLGEWYWYVEEGSDLGEDKALSPEILGHIFEKSVTNQKEKGAYYTPAEVTKYISEESIFRFCVEKVNEKFFRRYKDISWLVDSNSIKEIEYLFFDVLKRISVLDNAVGSGAFLLASHKTLLELYSVIWEKIKTGKSEQIKRENENIKQAKSSQYYFKKFIISHNLFGVDIEEGAIEICKLRLWLSLVSEFTLESVEPLPNVDYNVIKGNTLVGYIKTSDVQQITLTDNKPLSKILKELGDLKKEFLEESDPKKVKDIKIKIDDKISVEDKKLNKKLFNRLLSENINSNELTEDILLPFHWCLKFYEIISNGGFDIILGNPPYVRVQNLSYELIDIYKKRFHSAHKRIDLSILFIERSLNLLKEGGYSAFITSSQFLKAEYGRKIRKLMKNDLEEILYFGDNQIFDNATNYTSIFMFKKNNKRKEFYFVNGQKYNVRGPLKRYSKQNFCEVKKSELDDGPWALDDTNIVYLIKKIKNVSTRTLKDIANVDYGLVTGLDRVLILKNFNNISKLINEPVVFPLLKPRNISRYKIEKPDHYIIYPYSKNNKKTDLITEKELKKKSPNTYKYLLDNKEALLGREDSRTDLGSSGKKWFSLIRHSSFQKTFRLKILTQATCKKNEFCLDREGLFFTGGSIYSVYPREESGISTTSLLGLLNSKVAEFFYRITCPILQNKYRSYSGTFLKKLPIPLNFKGKMAELEELVIERVNRNEKEYEDKIDEIIYDLFKLTSKERKTLEEYLKN